MPPRSPSRKTIPFTHGLWGLWDMIRVFAEHYITLGRQIEDAQVAYAFLSDPEASQEFRDERAIDRRRCLKNLIKTCEELDLSIAHAAVSRAYDDPPQTAREFNFLINVVMDQIKEPMLLFVPQHLHRYYEWDGIVTDSVIRAFPKASEEIREAGTCLATGRFTACVFHAMRGAEIGLKALGASTNLIIKSGKPLDQAEWREILDGLSNVVRDIENRPNATPNKEEDLHFYSEASAQFRFFKNGWRVRAAHARATYLEPQAKEAIDHVRSFFETLAERLTEPMP
jgi:hypothetical protein